MGDDKLPESYQARLDELKVEYDRDGDAVFDRLVDDPIMYLLLLQRVNPEEAAEVIEDGLIDAGLKMPMPMSSSKNLSACASIKSPPLTAGTIPGISGTQWAVTGTGVPGWDPFT